MGLGAVTAFPAITEDLQAVAGRRKILLVAVAEDQRRQVGIEPVDETDGRSRMRPVVLDGCVGCGVCEMICPVESAAIVVDIDADADSLGV